MELANVKNVDKYNFIIEDIADENTLRIHKIVVDMLYSYENGLELLKSQIHEWLQSLPKSLQIQLFSDVLRLFHRHYFEELKSDNNFAGSLMNKYIFLLEEKVRLEWRNCKYSFEDHKSLFPDLCCSEWGS